MVFRAASNGTIRKVSSAAVQDCSRASLDSRFPLAMNVSPPSYFNPVRYTIDILKTANDWVNNATFNDSEVITTDANGWVTSLGAGQVVDCYFGNGEFPDPTGTWYLYYTGTASTWDLPSTTFTITTHDTGLKRYELDITAWTTGNKIFRMSGTIPGDYMKDIALVHEANLAAHLAGDLWDPDFVAFYDQFTGIRTMNFGIKDSTLATYTVGLGETDRRSSTFRCWNSEGGWSNSRRDAPYQMVPFEIQVQMCNDLGKDLWFCMPHLLNSADQVTCLEYLEANLNEGLTLYLELSNELWNGQFDQSDYMAAQGAILYPLDGATAQKRQASAHYSRLLMENAETVFAGQMHRLVRVGAWQRSTPGNGELFATWEDHDDHLDAIALGIYVGTPFGLNENYATTITWSETELLTELTTAIQDTIDDCEDYKVTTEALGLRLIAYEGGQSLVAETGAAANSAALTTLYDGVMSNAGFEDWYIEFLNAVKTVFTITGTTNADVFFLYRDVQSYPATGQGGGRFGAFNTGFAETPDPPKLLGIKAVIAANA